MPIEDVNRMVAKACQQRVQFSFIGVISAQFKDAVISLRLDGGVGRSGPVSSQKNSQRESDDACRAMNHVLRFNIFRFAMLKRFGD